MSLSYIDSNGNEKAISGLNGLSGEMVMGASTIRTGTFDVPVVDTSVSGTVAVSFSEPMTDSDYIVIINDHPSNQCIYTTYNKTKNGFTAKYLNVADSYMGAHAVPYTAFKLFTVEGLEDLENDVASLKAKTNTAITVTPTWTNTITGMSMDFIRCEKLTSHCYFVEFSMQLSSSYNNCDYTLGQLAIPGLHINGVRARGVLSGKLYVHAYTDANNYIVCTLPATYETDNGWIFFGRQEGLAGISTVSKMVTADNGTTRFSGVVYI